MNRKKRYCFFYFVYATTILLFVNVLLDLDTLKSLPQKFITIENLKPKTVNIETIAHLLATQIYYENKKQQCDDYGLNFSLYPSMYGFDACDTFEINFFEVQPKRAIVCSSSGVIDVAVFTKNSKGEQIECYLKNSKFSCFPRTNNYAVCGCDNCSDTSILNNLPIREYKPSRKVMAFSVYGENRDYVCGVLRQIRLAKLFFPDWMSRVYLNSSVPKNIAEIITREAEVVEIPKSSSFSDSGMFWRFMVAGDKNIDVYCIRDADSVFTYREAIAINKWIASGKSFNLMRDHKYHNTDIVGCCWCGQKKIKNIYSLMLKWSNRGNFGDDQHFLNSIIWPIINNDVLIYDTCKSRRNDVELPFPTERIACEFTGIAHRQGFYLWNYYQYLCYENENENTFENEY